MMHISKKYKKERKKIRQNCINTEKYNTVNSMILKRSEKEREKCSNADPVVKRVKEQCRNATENDGDNKTFQGLASKQNSQEFDRTKKCRFRIWSPRKSNNGSFYFFTILNNK